MVKNGVKIEALESEKRVENGEMSTENKGNGYVWGVKTRKNEGEKRSEKLVSNCKQLKNPMEHKLHRMACPCGAYETRTRDLLRDRQAF